MLRDVFGRRARRRCGSMVAVALQSSAAGYDPSSLRNGARSARARRARPRPARRRGGRRGRRRTGIPSRPVRAGRDSNRDIDTPWRRERLEQLMHRARPVRARHHERRLVAAGRADLLAAEHPEARRVVGLVLDVRRERRKAVDRRRRSRRRSPRRRAPRPRAARPRRCSPPRCAARPAGAARATARTARATARANRPCVTSSRPPAFDSRFWWTRSLTSPQTDSSVVAP